MCLGPNSEINNFVLEDRTMKPLKLEHEVLGITIYTNLNFYDPERNYVRKLKKQINLPYNSSFKG